MSELIITICLTILLFVFAIMFIMRDRELRRVSSRLENNMDIIFNSNSRLAQSRLELARERDQIIGIFNSIKEIIYISDIETYEIVFANDYVKSKFNVNLIGEKCYDIFHDNDKPCSFCNNQRLLDSPEKAVYWKFYNKKIDRYFIIMDKLISFNGRACRLQIAFDTTLLYSADDTNCITQQGV